MPVTTVAIATSTTADGSMAAVPSSDVIREHRRVFLARHGASPERAVLVRLSYETSDFTRYREVDHTYAGDGLLRPGTFLADALFTRELGLALFLPLGDCIGAAIEDRQQDIIGLSHLGRHNLEQHGGTRTIDYMIDHFGSRPQDIHVTLSPSAGKGNYPLFSFHHRSLEDVAVEQLVAAGLPADHITPSGVDTTTSTDYFSHSEYLASRREYDGRHAMMIVRT